MEKKEWIKYKCVYCNYEFASGSKTPRCTHCGSRRLNVITEFTNSKPFKKNIIAPPIAQEEEMIGKTPKPETKIDSKREEEQEEEQDDDDLDLFGDE